MKYNKIIECTMKSKYYKNDIYPNSFLLIQDTDKLDSDMNIDLTGDFYFNTDFELYNVKVIKEINSLKELYEFCKDNNININKGLIHNNGILVGGSRDYFIFNDLVPYGWIDEEIKYKTEKQRNELLDNLLMEGEEQSL